MNMHFIFSSLSRIANFQSEDISVKRIPFENWASGDYVVVEIQNPKSGSGSLKIELPNGRMIEPMKGDFVVGAFGTRFATVEATGSWDVIESDGKCHLLTGAGLIGKLTSKSFYVPELIEANYVGHVHQKGRAVSMEDFVPEIPIQKLTKPVVLMVGTSMSAGKTTAARIVTRQLKEAGLKVVGAKLTGAGRYQDILSVKDVGADYVFDFVDVGLPSSICPKKKFKTALKKLLSMVEDNDADIAVIEVGASPLEPYNGDVAIDGIKENLKCTILCASDPYAVYGVMKSYKMIPNIVSGIATNTLAGIALVEKLCKVPAINIIDPNTLPRLQNILANQLGVEFSQKIS